MRGPIAVSRHSKIGSHPPRAIVCRVQASMTECPRKATSLHRHTATPPHSRRLCEAAGAVPPPFLDSRKSVTSAECAIAHALERLPMAALVKLHSQRTSNCTLVLHWSDPQGRTPAAPAGRLTPTCAMLRTWLVHDWPKANYNKYSKSNKTAWVPVRRRRGGDDHRPECRGRGPSAASRRPSPGPRGVLWLTAPELVAIS